MKASAERTPERDGERDLGLEFAGRVREAIGGRVLAQVAKAIEIAPSTLHRYLNGTMPAADIALRLARHVGVDVSWLVEGIGQIGAPAASAEIVGISGQVTVLPRFDLFAFTEYGKPEPSETVALPTTWLMSAAKTTSGLWLAEMPNDALPSLAREGETLVCKDPEPSLQDRRIYIFLIDGRPIVRRAFVRPEGLQLRSEDEADTILITPHELEQITPIGRVVSAISVHSV